MLTVKHITPEGETTFGVERVRFVADEKTGHGAPRPVLYADGMPLTGGRVFVMNDKGSTVGKYELEERGR